MVSIYWLRTSYYTFLGCPFYIISGVVGHNLLGCEKDKSQPPQIKQRRNEEKVTWWGKRIMDIRRRSNDLCLENLFDIASTTSCLNPLPKNSISKSFKSVPSLSIFSLTWLSHKGMHPLNHCSLSHIHNLGWGRIGVS